ncbi:hypothetical protein ACWM1Q_17175, partial [Klebsiella grimontii]
RRFLLSWDSRRQEDSANLLPGKRTLGICWSIQVLPGESGSTLHFPGARALKCGAKNLAVLRR